MKPLIFNGKCHHMVHSNREACWCFHSGDSVIIPSGWACVTVTRVWLSYRSSIILITLLFFFNFTLISFVDFENRERKETWQRKKSLTVAVKWLGLWCNHSGWWCFLYVHTKTLVLCTHFLLFIFVLWKRERTSYCFLEKNIQVLFSVILLRLFDVFKENQNIH